MPTAPAPPTTSSDETAAIPNKRKNSTAKDAVLFLRFERYIIHNESNGKNEPAVIGKNIEIIHFLRIDFLPIM